MVAGRVSVSRVFFSGVAPEVSLIGLPQIEVVGYAAKAKTNGGSNGRILRVTNTNDSGSGSLRAALTAKGKRNIWVEATGPFELESRIIVENGDVTLYGNSQFAIGETITFQDCSNIIVYDFGVRLDADTSSPSDADSLNFINCSRFMVRNCCLGWGIDENLSFSGCTDFSVADNIVHEGLYDSVHSTGPHSMGGLFSEGCTRFTVFGNLYIHNGDRNPGFSAQNITMHGEFLNNLVYNPGTPAGGGGHPGWLWPRSAPFEMNIIGNRYKRGPSTGTNDIRKHGMWMYSDVASQVLSQDIADLCRVYQDDNWTDSDSEYIFVYDAVVDEGPAIAYPSFESSPLNGSGITPLPNASVESYILANAGTLVRDSHQTRLLNDYQNGTGSVIDDPGDISE